MDNFVDKLKSEGETIMPSTGKRGSDVSKVLPPPVNVERYTRITVYIIDYCLSGNCVVSCVFIRTSMLNSNKTVYTNILHIFSFLMF